MLGAGEGEGEGGEAGGGVVEGEGAAVGAHDFTGEAEAESGAVDVSVAGLVGAVEALEDFFAVFRGDAGAGVFDGEARAAAGGAAEGDADVPAGLVVFDGVGGEVLHDLAEQIAVGGDAEAGFDAAQDGECGGEDFGVVAGGFGQFGEVDGFGVEAEAAGVGEGEEEEFFDDGL